MTNPVASLAALLRTAPHADIYDDTALAEYLVARGVQYAPREPQPDEFFWGWNPGWVKIWREHEAKHPTPPFAKTWEQAYRHLALAVNSMPDTCDAECDSHGHSVACGEKDAAWPAEELVRLRTELARRSP